MKSYVICNNRQNIGYLFYYESIKSFTIELIDGIDPWEAPFLFQNFVENKVYTIPHRYARLWVMERIVPSGRQNISQVLKETKIKEYDEMKLLYAKSGRCSQDDLYIKNIAFEKIDESVKKRFDHKIYDVIPCDDYKVILILRNDTMVEINLIDYIHYSKKMKLVLENDELYKTIQVSVGGNGICFDGDIEIDLWDLVPNGTIMDIDYSQIKQIVRHSLVSTKMACDILGCTKQNIDYLNKVKKIEPFISYDRVNIYLKGDVLKLE